MPYDTIDEAVAIANDTISGLGAHVQGTDMEQARAVARRIVARNVRNGRPMGISGLPEVPPADERCPTCGQRVAALARDRLSIA